MELRPATGQGYITLKVTAVRDEAPEVKTLVLAPERPLVYKAGQFLTLVFSSGAGEERRSYSMSSIPGEPLSITVKRVPNGKYSRPVIDHLKVGDVLTTTGAAGQFTFSEDNNIRQVFFFAAGIGITPVFSMIKALLQTETGPEIILVYSNSSLADTVFYNELIQLHTDFPGRLRLEFLFSSSPDLSRARLSKWLLPQLLQIYLRGDKSEQLFYTCGPFAYMRMVTMALEEAGYPADRIRKENFDTSRPALKIEPPDRSRHYVKLVLREDTYTLPVQYPETILHAAKKEGISLPYSCETGRCGSCIMTCTEGKVWMSYNEVLTEKDMAQGKILTCVGFPVDGDVTLTF